jgi:hypothetical protein
VGLQHLGGVVEGLEHRRHRLFHRGRPVAHLLAGDLGQRLRGAYAGDDILALGVDEEFAIQPLVAGRGVAREGDAGGAIVTHVAEHHRLYIDRRAPGFRYVVHPAVELGAVVHPAVEHRADGAPELIARVLREGVAEFAADQGLVCGHHGLPVVGGEGGVDVDAELILTIVEDFLEHVVVEAQDHVRIHLDETAIAVEGEATVSGELGEPLHRLVVQAEVEHGVHHPRHRGARPRAHRHQQGVGRVAEALAHNTLDHGDGGVDFRAQAGRIGFPRQVEVVARLGSDGESRWHRQAQRRHLGEIGALAAEQGLHPGVAVGSSAAKGVDPFAGRRTRFRPVHRCLLLSPGSGRNRRRGPSTSEPASKAPSGYHVPRGHRN